jgi:hypothetical protein
MEALADALCNTVADHRALHEAEKAAALSQAFNVSKLLANDLLETTIVRTV